MRLITASLLTASCLFAAGCGSGEYQKKLNENIELLGKTSIFRDLSDPVTVPGTSLTFRLPKEFLDVKAKGADAAAAKLKMPAPLTFQEEPLSYYSYPRPRTAEAGEADDKPALPTEAPVYQVFLSKRDLPKGRGNPIAEMQNEVRHALSTEPVWEEVPFATDTGGSLTWKRIRVDAPMEFVTVKVEDGTLAAAKRQPGRFEVYMHEHNEAFAVMIWRVPSVYLPGGEGKPAEIDVNIDTLIKQVGGTLSGKQ